MGNPYILYSKMQTNYRKYKKGGAGANYAYRCFVAAAQELMEQDGPNPFDPQHEVTTKIQGVKKAKKEVGANGNDESASTEWAH